MVRRFFRILSILFIIGFSYSTLFGQSERYTEDDILLQNQFIEAIQEKLLGHPDKAMEILKTILKQDRKNHVVAYELARIYHEQKDFTNALNYCNKAISNENGNSWYWDLKSRILVDNRQYGPAAAAFKKLSELEPTEISNYYKWAENLNHSGDFVGSIEAYNQIEKKFGVQEMSAKAKFQIYQQMGNVDNSIEELKKLALTFPNDVRILNNLAGFLQKNGREKEAYAYYQNILKIEPNHPQANLILAGNIENPSDESAYLKSIQALIQNTEIPIEHKVKELMPYLEQFISEKDQKLGNALLFTTDLLQNTHPEDARAYALYADVLIHSGRMEEAIRKYKKTLSIDDSKLAVWEQLMYALSKESRYDELAETCESALDLFPNQAICYYYYGMAQLHQNIYTEAKSNLEEVRFIASKNPRLKAMAEVMMAHVYIKELNWDQANEYLEIAQKTFPKSQIEVMELKGDINFLQGDIEKAVEFWQMAKELGNTSPILQQKILQKQFIE